MNDNSLQVVKTLWITGLACSGKTTLARLIVTKLKNNGYPCFLIDGKETREKELHTNKLGFDPQSRREQTRRISNLVKWTISQDILPVVTIINPFEDDRVKIRREIPGYFEVYLKCNLDECAKRDKNNLYAPAIRGEKRFVVGVDIQFEEHKHSDLILESDKLHPEKLLELLWDHVNNRLYDNRLY